MPIKSNQRYSTTVSYEQDDIRYTAENKKGYHPHGYHVYFTKTNGESLVWNTLISPTRSNPVEKHCGKNIVITYEIDFEDELGRIHIKNVRFKLK